MLDVIFNDDKPTSENEGVDTDEDTATEEQTERSCTVVVPDNQLSLAIGKRGQNARLAARLTKYKIDIKSASEMENQETEDSAIDLEETQDIDESED